MTYPILFLRIKAVLLDSIVVTSIYFLMVLLCIRLSIKNTELKALIILLPVTLFEPILIRLTGGSVGHHYAGIKVVHKETGENLFIPHGVVRFLAKTFFGVFSFVSMLITPQHRAVHDVLSGSVVLFKSESTAPSHHKLVDRELVSPDQKPSIKRRLLVAFSYSVLSWFLFSVSVYFFSSKACIEKYRCTDAENMSLACLSLCFFVALVVIFILSFRCRIPGAYCRSYKNT